MNSASLLVMTSFIINFMFCYSRVVLSSIKICLTTREARSYMLWRHLLHIKKWHVKPHRSLVKESGRHSLLNLADVTFLLINCTSWNWWCSFERN